ncbi:MAG: hypothetical protein EX266_02505 [Rhodobacteraceae bacterium]|nr:hypothetical protein [Silicimonas sp.]RZW11460.1 MAG: hypothetical protein EX266_02505 [Paracoccaceae bacterium]
MTQEPYVRLHLFFATENDRALIVRQGPTRQFRMILWHRDTDTFEDGQWIRQKVYIERCSLSPDGRHFIYFLLDGHWSAETRGSFTALSRPPYWTALSLFPEGDTWGGGGVFLDSTHYWASGDADIIGRDEGLARVTFGAVEKGCSTGIRLMTGGRAPLDRAATKRLLAEPPPADERERFARMAVPTGDARDRYDTQGGILYRRHGLELEPIRDFTDMEFEPVRAPYDWRDAGADDGTAAWHPLDGDA